MKKGRQSFRFTGPRPDQPVFVLPAEAGTQRIRETLGHPLAVGDSQIYIVPKW
jgi:hypothetical protein